MNNNSDQSTLIFLHIPKTAGSSLYSILENQYPSARSFKIKSKNIPESLRQFKNLPLEKRREIKLVYGHMNFGIHNSIPVNARYFTLLRNPVERIISHYYYVLRRPGHYLYQKVKQGKMTLKDYVSSAISTELNNGQVRLISGTGSRFRYGQCPYSLLEKSKENLKEKFVLTGLIDFFDETILMLKERLNWEIPVYFKEKVTLKRHPVKDIDEDTIEVIKNYNRLDLELYEYIKIQFKQELNSQSKFLQVKLKAFRILNDCWRKQYAKLLPQRRIKLRITFNRFIIKSIIEECEILLKENDYETASWLIKYCQELYPSSKKNVEMSNLFSTYPPQ